MVRVLVVINADSTRARDAALLLSAYFNSQGIEHVLFVSDDLPPAGPPAGLGLPNELLDDDRFAYPFTLAVVLGGDGTILRTARIVASEGTPVLGLNFGHLGFLAEECTGSPVEAVAAALAGETVSERRSNLRIDVICDDDCYECGGALQCHECLNTESSPQRTVDGRNAKTGNRRSFFALNEMAISRNESGLIVDFGLGVSGELVAKMRGDGVVVSSATGSTAYALSAGGPLVAPGHRGLVVVPIAPHTLMSRAMVTGEEDVVEINLSDDISRRNIALFADGNKLPLDSPIRRVIVQRGKVPTTLLHFNHQHFYKKVSDVFFHDARCY